MTIAEYLKAHNLTLTAFSASIGEGVTTVHGWVSGRRRPGVRAVARIEEVTSGEVRAADFVATASSSCDSHTTEAAA